MRLSHEFFVKIITRRLRCVSLFIFCKNLHFKIREESPHLMIGNIATVRKMGFPEVILPGDVRNDLYLTLEYGEFSKGTKSSDKNIETVVTICSEKGVPLQVLIIVHFLPKKEFCICCFAVWISFVCRNDENFDIFYMCNSQVLSLH